MQSWLILFNAVAAVTVDLSDTFEVLTSKLPDFFLYF